MPRRPRHPSRSINFRIIIYWFEGSGIAVRPRVILKDYLRGVRSGIMRGNSYEPKHFIRHTSNYQRLDSL